MMKEKDIETRVKELEEEVSEIKEMWVDMQKEMREGFAHLEKLIFNCYKMIYDNRMPKIKPKYTDKIDLDDEK